MGFIPFNKVQNISVRTMPKFMPTSEVLGVSMELFGALPIQYRVKIKSVRKYGDDKDKITVVRAIMQDKAKIGVEGNWIPVMNQGIRNVVNIATQFFIKQALITQIGTRRIWQGASPLSITLPLKFETVFFPTIEVLKPCVALQNMALPSKSVSGLPFLVPPGPSPFIVDGNANNKKKYNTKNKKNLFSAITNNKYWKKFKEFSKEGESISIEIGTFLRFSNVIIKEVEVEWDNKYSVMGKPMGATALITFQTYEMLTKEDLLEAYKL